VTAPLPHVEQLPANHLAHPLLLVTVGTAAVGMTIAAGVLGASAQTGDPTATAALRAAIVAAPLGAAFYAWRLVPFQRFAHLLAGAGVVGFVTTLAEASDPTLYSVGRAAGWTLELLLVALLLGFPDGPLRGRDDRRLVLAMGAIVAIFYFPTLLLTESFQVPSPYTSCVGDCPVNAFALYHRDLSLTPLFLGTGSVLVFAIMAAVLVRLRRRVLDASAVQREALSPVFAVGIVRASLVGTFIVLRQAGANTELVQAGATLIAWTTPAIAIAFIAGLFRARLAAERTVRALAASVRGSPPALQRSVAEAFADPTLQLTFPLHGQPHRWVDSHGEPAPAPAPVEGRCLRLVRDGHHRIVGALTGDRILADRPELLDVAAGLIAVAVEQRRLEEEAEAATREAQDSRARLAESADAERRRIERDLHDGAQQRLVAMRVELGLVEDLLHDDPESAAARIRELEASADEALEELRSLAHGVRPPLLNDRGLPDAVRAAVARLTLPTAFQVEGVGRYPPAVESAVYFSVLEALQNVAKHAHGASRVTVHLRDDACGELRFEVRDDGPGTDQEALERGEGMTNIRDRVAAVDGTLRVVSLKSLGTVVAGRIPVSRAQRMQDDQQS
jgi:signal transduction histidine kinase